MGLTQLNFAPNLGSPEVLIDKAGRNKVGLSIMRLREFEPPEGYYLAFSGGKDSVVVYDLTVRAGVKFDAHYSQGGIDPPELVRFIQKNYPNVDFDRPKMSIWQGIVSHGLPRRQGRWCCELIKEHHGAGRRVITGIRWQESPRRKNRRMVEVCHSDKTKIFINPIIDWTCWQRTKNGRIIRGGDIWDYIRENKIPYCSLYDEDFKRLGCVLCPMETAKQTQLELKRFPKLADAWRRATYRLYDKRKALGNESVERWDTAEDMWQWWLSRKGEPKVNKAQCIMFDN